MISDVFHTMLPLRPLLLLILVVVMKVAVLVKVTSVFLIVIAVAIAAIVVIYCLRHMFLSEIRYRRMHHVSTNILAEAVVFALMA